VAEVFRAEEEFRNKLLRPDMQDVDEDAGSEEEEEEGSGNYPEWAGVMMGEQACGEEDSGDTDLFMGDASTEWHKLSFDCAGNPGMMCQGFADQLADKETEKALRPPEAVTHEHFQSLTRGQKAAVQMVLNKMMELRQFQGSEHQVKPLRLIVAGTAGTGKTRIIKIINAAAHKLLGPQSIRNVAPSGTAAYLMGGRTLHSLFPIPIGPAQYKPMKPPRADRLIKLQQELDGVKCLCVDERSMIGTVVFGWMEFMLRMGMNMGQTASVAYGGLPILVLFGDDGQLPPVNSQRLFSSKSQSSSAGQMGQQLYSHITECIFLTDVVRQRGQACNTCSSRWHSPGALCNRLGEFLCKLRYQRSRVGVPCETIKEADVEWLRERQEHCLRLASGGSFDMESSIAIHPKVESVMAENRKQLEAMSRRNIPVVKCLAKDCGPCVRTKMKQGKGEYEFGQLPKKTLLCKGAPVMLTTNLCTEWGLFNGAMGTVVDIYFASGRMPSVDGQELPDVVFVDMPSYCGQEVVPGFPTLVPIGPRVVQECCGHECTRVQVPLRLCWAITVHKSQGMTIGSQQHMKAARIHLGDSNTEKWAAGAAFVQLSRVSEIQALCIEGPVDLDRFTFWSAGKQAVAVEDERLYQMHVRTLREHSWLGNEAAFGMMVQEYFNAPG
jgi:ATP-dependent DNA helicase PIF1